MSEIIIEVRTYNPQTGRSGSGGFVLDDTTTAVPDEKTGYTLLKPSGKETFAVVKFPQAFVQARLDILRQNENMGDLTANWDKWTVRDKKEYTAARKAYRAEHLKR